MRILLIEDEKKTSAYLKKGLMENGFVVDAVNNGIDGLFQATNQNYDLMIVDIMLPRLDSWSVIAKTREQNKGIPILALTARDAVEDRVKGLELGVDDYLIKPFSFSELLARVRTLLRRGQVAQQPDIIKIADLEINLSQHKATRAKDRLSLTSKEFMLLALLAKNKREMLSRAVIAEQVWDMNFDSDTNVIDVMVKVKRLTEKVDQPYEIKLIHTIRGGGYVLDEK